MLFVIEWSEKFSGGMGEEEEAKGLDFFARGRESMEQEVNFKVNGSKLKIIHIYEIRKRKRKKIDQYFYFTFATSARLPLLTRPFFD